MVSEHWFLQVLRCSDRLGLLGSWPTVFLLVHGEARCRRLENELQPMEVIKLLFLFFFFETYYLIVFGRLSFGLTTKDTKGLHQGHKGIWNMKLFSSRY